MEEIKNVNPENANAENGAYVEVDKNMIIASSIDKPDLKLYDAREEPFDLYGFYDTYGQPYLLCCGGRKLQGG